MLSSITRKKISPLIAFTLLTSIFAVSDAQALSKLVFIDEKRNEIEMNVDSLGNVHIISTPVAGEFYYKKSSEEFIFRLEGMEAFYRLPISKLRLTEAGFKKVKSQDRRITDTHVWDIKALGKSCGIVKASASMVKDIGLTIADMVSINNAFAYILGDNLSDKPCLNFSVNKAAAENIGFPLYLSTNYGTTMLKEEGLLEYGRRVLMPRGAVIVSDEHMQAIYLHQMPEAARELYKTLSHGKSGNQRQRLKAVRKSLQMVRAGKWKPKAESAVPEFTLNDLRTDSYKPSAPKEKEVKSTPISGGFGGL